MAGKGGEGGKRKIWLLDGGSCVCIEACEAQQDGRVRPCDERNDHMVSFGDGGEGFNEAKDFALFHISVKGLFRSCFHITCHHNSFEYSTKPTTFSAGFFHQQAKPMKKVPIASVKGLQKTPEGHKKVRGS